MAVSVRGQAMSKTIAIYGVQVVLGVVALASGYAKISGMDLMVHHFEMLGLGQGFRLVAGSAEIIAGLCLLMPRGGILGAVLLATVMVGALGVTIGHVASNVAYAAPAGQFSVSHYQAVAKSGPCDSTRPFTVTRKAGWDI
jgi:uncharacterized membrane protein YphA (DoxX/SURF4 family)